MHLKSRLHLPSLPSLEGPAWREYTLLVLLLCTVLVTSLKPVDDPDTFWHLAVGREVWQTGHLVHTETFSFTAPGAGWEDTEWLFHALLFPLWRILGSGGLSVAVAILAAGVVGLGYRSVRLMGGGAMTMSLYMVIMMPAFQTRVSVRPDIFSLVFMALLIEGLLRWRPHDGKGGRFWLFTAPLFWAWCQIHGGWSYGLALLGISTAGLAADALREKRLTRCALLQFTLPVLAPVAALFLNPFGWRIPWFPIKHLLSFADPTLPTIAEWQHTPWSMFTSPVVAMLFFAALAQFWPFRPFAFRDALWCSTQAGMGLYWARYAGYAGLTIAPFASRDLMKVLRTPALRRLGWALALVALLATAVTYHSFHRDPGDMLARYPVQEVRYLLDRGVRGKVLHNYEVGGYLAWVAPHQLLSFFDGRFFCFIQPSKDFRTADRSVESYRTFLDKYAFDVALAPSRPFKLKGAAGGPPRGSSTMLFPKEKWAFVFFGEYGPVFLRREPAYETLIARDGYAVLRLDDLEYLLWAARSGRVDGPTLEMDLLRAISQSGLGRQAAPLREALAKLRSGRDQPL